MDPAERSDEVSMDELWRLAETAGAEPVGAVLQTRDKPDPHSFLGMGKVQELKDLVQNEGCDLVMFDNDLTPSQARVLEEALGVRVLDRTGLILDIFAQRARTREGKLQVELAQYKYLLPRLTGMWTHLKRQAGTSSWRRTAGTSAGASRSSRRSLNRCAGSGAPSGGSGRETPCPWRPWWAIPTRARAPF